MSNTKPVAAKSVADWVNHKGFSDMADIARRYNLVAHAVADILEFIAFDEMAADLRTAIAAGEIKMTNEINPHMNTTDNNK